MAGNLQSRGQRQRVVCDAAAFGRAMVHDDNVVEVIASEISRYLLRHREAADTLEGIQAWWLTRIRIEEAAQRVKQALDRLVRRGVVVEEPLPDGGILYPSARR